MQLRLLASSLLLVLSSQSTGAQARPPVETRNAALRYWMAFAEMQDPPADKSTQDLLEKTSAGQATWEEAKLGKILDSNREALQTMQRATLLPDCDWGLEYSRGPRAPIAYLARARVMARLNTLQATREKAAGDPHTAVERWLAGIRFSVHLASGGSLLSMLTAKNAMLPNLRMLTLEAGKGGFVNAQVKQATALVNGLRPDGFDWAGAWDMEEMSIEAILEELKSSKTPKATYEASMGEAMPQDFLPPSTKDLTTFREYMSSVKAALKLPPDVAQDRLAALDPQRRALSKWLLQITPAPRKVNESRSEIVVARKELLEALRTK